MKYDHPTSHSVTTCYSEQIRNILRARINPTHMRDKLLEILPRLLHPRRQDDRLLQPIRSLQQIIRLQQRRHLQHRVRRPECGSVVPPDRETGHDVDTEGAEEAKVDGGVALFGESFRLAAWDTEVAGEGGEEVHCN